MSHVEKSRILIDVGNGLLCRCYYSLHIFTKDAPAFLQSAELKKVRDKVEKQFPEPDIGNAKIAGYELFVGQAPEISEKLLQFEELVDDIAEYSKAVVPLLQSFSRDILEVKLERNQDISLLFLDLLVTYMRVMMLFTAIPDRKMIYSLRCAAAFVVNGSRSRQISDAVILFRDGEHLQRHFIDSFVTCYVLLRPLMCQLQDSLAVYEDCDSLRNSFTLNPINDGDKLGLPSQKKLNQQSNLSVFTELANCDRYTEYVVFGHLACPSLLYASDSFQVFKRVASGLLFLPVFRDVTLSIHMDFEALLDVFPVSQDQIMVPPGFKIKAELKEIARAAVNGTAGRLKYRRAFIMNELHSFIRILMCSPGLLAPKFPQLLAATSFAKAEALHYLRHIRQDEKAVRKDCRKYFVPDTFKSSHLAPLLWQLHTVGELICRHHVIIRRYYVEYLKINDLPAIEVINSNSADILSTLRAFIEGLISDLRAVDIESPLVNGEAPNLTGVVSPGAQISAPICIHPIDGEESTSNTFLLSFRLNANRATMVLSNRTVASFANTRDPIVDTLCLRMQASSRRTLFVDSIEHLVRTFVSPHEAWWFRQELSQSYRDAIKDVGLENAKYFSGYIGVLRSVGLNLHKDAMMERDGLADMAVRTCDAFVTALLERTLVQLEVIWTHFQALDTQIKPYEAARRIEKGILHKQKKLPGAFMQEPLPGFESEAWAKKSIEVLTGARLNVNLIVSAAHALGTFRIHMREYTPMVFLRQRIVSMLQEKLHGIFLKGCKGDSPQDLSKLVHKDDKGTKVGAIERPSVALKKFIVGCHATQVALSCTHNNFPASLRSMLFIDCIDLSVPPPGATVGVEHKPSNDALIWKIATWFGKLAIQFASNPGYVWAPTQRIFASLERGAGAGGTHWDVFMNPDDLKCLCNFIGVQGVRVIDSQLLAIVAAKIDVIFTFLSEQRAPLAEFYRDYCINHKAAIKIRGMPDFEQALTQIGICLVMRQMLHEALGESLNAVSPNLKIAVSSVAQSLRPWGSRAIATPVHTLGADVGHMMPEDLPLIESLGPCLATRNPVHMRFFPIAAAAIFASDRWDHTNYIHSLEAFEKNEHCAVFAAAKLMTCLAAHWPAGSDPDDEAKSTISSDYSGVASNPRDICAEISEKYVRLSAQVLLTLRIMEADSKYVNRPLRGMCSLLEFFTQVNPTIDRLCLEKYLPFSLLHTGMVDMALGRHKHSDGLRRFNDSALAPSGDADVDGGAGADGL